MWGSSFFREVFLLARLRCLSAGDHGGERQALALQRDWARQGLCDLEDSVRSRRAIVFGAETVSVVDSECRGTEPACGLNVQQEISSDVEERDVLSVACMVSLGVACVFEVMRRWFLCMWL